MRFDITPYIRAQITQMKRDRDDFMYYTGLYLDIQANITETGIRYDFYYHGKKVCPHITKEGESCLIFTH